MSKTALDLEFLTDIICLFSLFCFNFFYEAYATVTETGFHCEDLSIRYPYLQIDKKESFQLVEVYFLPLLMAWTCEAVIFPWKDPKVRKMKFFFLLYDSFVAFTFGYLLSTASAVFLQKSTGVLKPYFLSVCKPNIDCSNPDNQNRYITNYTCTSNDSMKVSNARLSFPSSYCLQVILSTFLLVLVLETKLHVDAVNLVKRLIQSFILFYGHIQCALRFRENESHWSDILVGYIMGVGFAYFNVGRFKAVEKKSSPVQEHNLVEQIPSSQIISAESQPTI
ncbi:phospholipid phosphatase 3-like [Cimex lectularius]|uniref:Phosphatidic acid phosphatase type 2/haloperoxidase domain-containing protein n=1 Tax=Cimex lectularius TaxID=79782 RepID=A0A8I6S1Y4_CIMLE|nr:phospholipid phosphatase 3-like [Cimex lectularius]